jgi:hypothetical protein
MNKKSHGLGPAKKGGGRPHYMVAQKKWRDFGKMDRRKKQKSHPVPGGFWGQQPSRIAERARALSSSEISVLLCSNRACSAAF